MFAGPILSRLRNKSARVKLRNVDDVEAHYFLISLMVSMFKLSSKARKSSISISCDILSKTYKLFFLLPVVGTVLVQFLIYTRLKSHVVAGTLTVSWQFLALGNYAYFKTVFDNIWLPQVCVPVC